RGGNGAEQAVTWESASHRRGLPGHGLLGAVPTPPEENCMTYPIATIAVVGSGYMGGGIAQVFARAGFSVLIADRSAEVAAAAHHRLVEEAQRFEDRGLFAGGAAAAIRHNLSAASSVDEAAAAADLVIEAVFEDLEVKTAVLRQISEAARAETIIGTNTSTMSVNTLKPAVSHP